MNGDPVVPTHDVVFSYTVVNGGHAEVARHEPEALGERPQTSSRNSVRACSLTESCTTCAKSSSAQSRRAKPTR